jgi:cell division septation protein DedD
MKTCSKCNRNYPDEELNFCLDDGSPLNPVPGFSTDESITRPTEQATAILTEDKIPSFQSEIKTVNLPNEQETVVRKQFVSSNESNIPPGRQGVSPFFAYMTVGLLALLVLISGIALAVWLNTGSGNSNAADESELAKTNSANSAENEFKEGLEINASAINSEKSNSKDKKPITKENPKPKETAKPVETNSPETTPKPTETPKAEKGKWFVILGSFPQSQAGQARQRLQLARSKGLNVRLVNTNNYPGLRNGLVAVVMGPFSKTEAQSALRRARTVSRDAYVKAG